LRKKSIVLINSRATREGLTEEDVNERLEKVE